MSIAAFLGQKEYSDHGRSRGTAGQQKRWTDEDIQKLLDNSHLSNKELGALLGRSADAIGDKRRKIERRQGIGYQRKEKL